MLQLATPPDRPRPALLASIGVHALAASAFGLGPLLAFPDAPGWRGEVWAVTQPDLSVLRETRPVDLRDRVPVPAPARSPTAGGLPAAPRAGAPAAPAAPALQPGAIPPDLPAAPDVAPVEDPGGPGIPGGVVGVPGSGTGTGPGDGPGGPIDVREGLPPDIVLPVPLRTPPPGYSDVARLARASGVVVLSATIAADGTVVDVAVENDAHPLLSRLAVEAVSTWRYLPARIGTRPVAVILRVTLTFRLL